jgi:hypothetical protein
MKLVSKSMKIWANLLNEKCFLLTATGLFVVFTLFASPLFSMITLLLTGGQQNGK